MQSALFVGRFQPFHIGHLDVVKTILKTNDRVVIVIGSAEKNFLPENPLTAGERFQLIDEALKEAKIPAEKYAIIPVRNVNNYALWVNHINVYVPPYTRIYTGSNIVKACYEGKCEEIIQVKRKIPVSATKIREAILKKKKWENMVPKVVAKKLNEWHIPKRLQAIEDTMDLTKYNDLY